MESKTLTSEQIEQLHKFCAFHDVKYYDVQIELVDHLATAIEKLWETEHELSFDEALFRVAEKFGVDPFRFSAPDSLLPFPIGKENANAGFDAITEARTKALGRRYDRLQIRYFFEFFKLPKIVLTISSILVIFILFRSTNNKILTAGIVQGIFLCAFLSYWFFVYRKEIKLKIVPEKSFLLYDYLRTWKNTPLIFAILSPAIINAITKLFEIQDKYSFFNFISAEFLAAIIITLFAILAIVTGIYLPKRIKEDIQKEFPQFCN